MAQLKDLIVNGPSRFIGDVYATTFTGDLNGNANTATSATTAATATTALSCSGNSATATLANEAKNLQNTTPKTKDESFFSKIVTEDADMISFQTLKGNSVVWNQLAFTPRTYYFQGKSAGKFTASILNNVITITATSERSEITATEGYCEPMESYKYILGHRYFVAVKVNPSVDVEYSYHLSNAVNGAATVTLQANKWSRVSLVSTLMDTSYGKVFFGMPKKVSVGDTIQLKEFEVTDLTQMFGAGNEPSTVEEFLQRKPFVEDEFAYNEGTIVDNKVEKVVTTGRNIWDEEWELGAYNPSTGEKLASSNQIRSKNMFACLPNTSYYCRIPNKANGTYMGTCLFYDISRAFISSAPVGPSSFLTVTTPSNARFVAFQLRTEYGTTYNHDICINLSDPAINGKYFPYEEHTLDLSWVKDIKDAEGVKLFEDGMRSAGAAFDEVTKNKAVKRIAVSTFNGTEDWRINSYANDKGVMAYQCYSKFKPINENIRCDRFATRSWSSSLVPMSIFAIPKNGIIIETDGTQSLDDFKTSLEAKPLEVYYELAEPIEVELPYGINHTLPVWKDGMMYAESSQSSTPIVCTNAYYTNIRESVKKFIGDADSIYASTSGYNAHGIWNIDISGNAATATNADKLGNIVADNYFKQRDAVFNSDWGGKYLWTLWDNHLYAADKRFAVTLTGTGATNLSYLFDGSFESSVTITEDQAVLHIKHPTAGNVWTEGLPYGNFYVVFYDSDAENVTGRVYCNYDGHGIGWHDLTATHVRPHVWELDNDYHQLSDLEITITKPASSAFIQLCQVLYEVTRSAGPDHAAVMSKYCYQKTNYDIEAAGFIKTGGTSSQFLKADGSVDWNTYSKSGHTHTGSEVKLTGYSKASSYSAIAASDTVQAAIGKLEGAISGLEELLASI